jgi:hypothetical protein
LDIVKQENDVWIWKEYECRTSSAIEKTETQQDDESIIEDDKGVSQKGISNSNTSKCTHLNDNNKIWVKKSSFSPRSRTEKQKASSQAKKLEENHFTLEVQKQMLAKKEALLKTEETVEKKSRVYWKRKEANEHSACAQLN